MTDFRDIAYFIFILYKSSLQETYFFNQGVSFLSLKKKYSLHTKMTSFFFSLFFFYILVTLRFEILRFYTVALMTKITNSYLSAESLHTNTIYIRKTKIGGDRTHLRPFTFSSLVFFWHSFAVKHAISAISHMICSYIHCSELTGSVLSS